MEKNNNCDLDFIRINIYQVEKLKIYFIKLILKKTIKFNNNRLAAANYLLAA